MNIATLGRCLGFALLCLAVGASRGADPLLRFPLRRRERYGSRNQRLPCPKRLQHPLLRPSSRRIDTLTGIGTHAAALHEIDRLTGREEAFVLLRMSIDNVEQINRTLGYRVGDQLLVALTRRLVRLQYHRGRLYRLGGNEFLMLVAPPFVQSFLLQRLHEQLNQPLELQGTALIPSVTLVELSSPDHGGDAQQLLYRSGIALDKARRSREGYHAYQNGLEHLHEREMTLLRDLVQAVREQQLRVVYQPKMRIADGKITGFEALLQWQHPTLGLLQPDEFLPLAMHSGHMSIIGHWMIEHALDDLAHWQTQGHRPTVAINLTAVDLEDPQLVKRLLKALAVRGLSPRYLMLEITEQAIMLDSALAARLLAELRGHGVQVAIDDFGTGYSSLTQLRRLPLDALKIDKSFVFGLPHQAEDATIVRSNIALAHDFGLEVIAEGVENAGQLASLTAAGCDHVQGFLVARAMAAEQVVPWLESYRSAPAIDMDH